MRPNAAAKAYARTDTCSKTVDRSAGELVILLLDKACSCLRRACLLLKVEGDLGWEDRSKNIEEFFKSTGRATQIVVALREMLDMESGGELSSCTRHTRCSPLKFGDRRNRKISTISKRCLSH